MIAHVPVPFASQADALTLIAETVGVSLIGEDPAGRLVVEGESKTVQAMVDNMRDRGWLPPVREYGSSVGMSDHRGAARDAVTNMRDRAFGVSSAMPAKPEDP